VAATDLADLPFRGIWCVDFEFTALPGELPNPACLIAWEQRSGKKIRLWRDAFGPLPPYPTDADNLFVAYYTSAELGCHRALGWPIPKRILDLFVEFRDQTNGCGNLAGNSLLGALAQYGLDHIGVVEKDAMRNKFIAGNFDAWTDEERREGLDYCETDVRALAGLLPAMMARKSQLLSICPKPSFAAGIWRPFLRWSIQVSRSMRSFFVFLKMIGSRYRID
jgi:DNA polymerase-1